MDYLMTNLYRYLKWIWFFSVIYIKFHEIFQINVRRTIRCYLLKFSFASNLHDRIVCRISSYSFRHFEIRFWYKNKGIRQMLSFLPLKNNSATIELNFSLDSISYILYQLSYYQKLLTLSFSLLDYSLLNFHKHHHLFVNNQWMLSDFLILQFLPLLLHW